MSLSPVAAAVPQSPIPSFIPKKPISTSLVFNDHSKNRDDSDSDGGQSVARGGVVTPFPWKVHDMLEKSGTDGIDHIVNWLPHGRAFMVHRPQEFVDRVMPMWFSQTKFASFQRQLNLYGFRRLTQGRDKGAYFNENFLRGERGMIQRMSRQKIKGTKVRRAVVPGMEPDFWNLPFVNGKNNAKGEMHIKLPDQSFPNEAVRSGPPTPTLSPENFMHRDEGTDVLFFEGKPFHYLDRAIVTGGLSGRVVSGDFDSFGLPLETV